MYAIYGNIYHQYTPNPMGYSLKFATLLISKKLTADLSLLDVRLLRLLRLTRVARLMRPGHPFYHHLIDGWLINIAMENHHL